MIDHHNSNADPKPAWVTLLVGYLAIHGFFATVYLILLDLDYFQLVWDSTVRAAASRWVSDFARYLGSLLFFLTPVLELGCAYPIWRRPERARWLITILGVLWAYAGILGAVQLAFGWVDIGPWRIGVCVASVARGALGGFAIWFVWNAARLRRPAAVLVAWYLILTGMDRGVRYVDGVVSGGLAEALDLLRWSSAWPSVFGDSTLAGVTWPRLRSGTGGLRSLHVPYWLPLTAALGPTVYLWRRDRRRLGVCQSCGYNLTGNVSGVCPECGEAAFPHVNA